MVEHQPPYNTILPLLKDPPMKYGIKATAPGQPDRYASRAKSYSVSLTNDITEAALFAQEKSAIAAVKKARVNGCESKYKCVLSVIEVVYAVEREIEVPHPPVKKGFVIQIGKEWYDGVKKGEADFSDFYYNRTDAIEGATVFADMHSAQKKLDAIIAAGVEAIEEKQEEIVKVQMSVTLGVGMSPRLSYDPHALRLASLTDSLDRFQQLLTNLHQLTNIVEVGNEQQ